MKSCCRILQMLVLALVLPAGGALAQATPRDAAALGQALAAAFNERSADDLLKLVDTEAFSDRVLEDLDVSAGDRQALRSRLPLSVRKNAEMSMRALGESEGSAKYLRAGVENGRAYALLRLDMGDRGVDYVKYYASSPGAVEDWYIFTAASLYSSAVRFNLATLLRTDSLFRKLLGVQSVSRSDAKAFIAVRDRLAKDDYRGAFQALERFPEAYRQSRQWALMRVTVGGRAGDDAYRQALRHLAATFGDQADLQLALIDHYFFEKELDRALAAVASLEDAIGGEDASTNNLRGNLLIALDRPASAEAACRRGIELEADYAPVYWCLVSIALGRNDGRLAVDALTAYEKAFGVRFDPAELARQEAYGRIGKTREFAAWAKARRR